MGACAALGKAPLKGELSPLGNRGVSLLGAEPLRPLRGHLPFQGRLWGARAALRKAPLKGELSPLGD